MRRASQGFSLIELLVALAVTGLLMAGMSKVFATSIANLHASRELTGAGRRNRWMMDRLSDDLKMAGHTDGMAVALDALPEPGFLVLPGGTEDQPLDTLQLFSNQPLIEGELAEFVAPGGTTFKVNPDGANELHLQAGDWFFLKDGERSEVGFVQDAGGNLVTMMGSSEAQALPAAQVMDQGAGLLTYGHSAGARVAFLRPLQFVRYSIRNLAVDPSDLGTLVPCLVRQEATYTGSAVDWDKVPAAIQSEQVHALRIDLSPDAGKTWTRKGAESWDDIKSLANAMLDSGLAIDDSALWFKRTAMLIRVDLTSRTATSRTEFAPKSGETAYGLRTQTLMVAPRNFANPI